MLLRSEHDEQQCLYDESLYTQAQFTYLHIQCDELVERLVIVIEPSRKKCEEKKFQLT